MNQHHYRPTSDGPCARCGQPRISSAHLPRLGGFVDRPPAVWFPDEKDDPFPASARRSLQIVLYLIAFALVISYCSSL